MQEHVRKMKYNEEHRRFIREWSDTIVAANYETVMTLHMLYKVIRRGIMNLTEYTGIKRDVEVLERIRKSYAGKTIDNVIKQLKSRMNWFEEKNHGEVHQ